MTTLQLHVFNGLYLALLIVVSYLTRATARRIAGALAGGVALGVLMLGAVALGEERGWWHFVIAWEPYFLMLLLLDGTISGAAILLVTWRVARRFGWRGLAVVVVILAIIGPPRDYAYMKTFPEWGEYGPGIAPFVAVALIYALLVPVGQSVMRLVAGPARADPLARRAWEVAK